MPRVPVYDSPQVTARAIPDARQSSVASPGLFSAGADDLVQTGNNLMAAGNRLGQIATQIQAEDNETAAKAIDTEFANYARDVLNHPEQGFLTKQGKNALDQRQATYEALEKKRKELFEKAPNDNVRRMVDQVSAQRMLGYRDTIDAHSRQQRTVHMKATSELRLDGLTKDLADNWADPTKHSLYLNAVKKEATDQADLLGITGPEREALVNAYASKGHQAVLNRMISSGFTDEAENYLKQNGKELDEKVADHFRDKVETLGGLKRSQSFADQIMSQPGMSEAKALAAAREKFSGKDEQHAVAEIKTRFAERQHQQNEGNKWAMGQAQDWIIKNPGQPITKMPPNLYMWAKSTGHLAGLDGFAQREGRPAERLTEAKERGKLLQMAGTDPDAFIAEFKRSGFADRFDLGVTGIKEMQNIAADMLRGNGRYKSDFDTKIMADAIPPAIRTGTSNADARDAFVAIQHEEQKRWQKNNPGKVPTIEDQRAVAAKANEAWIQIGAWNREKPAYAVRDNADAVPKWFFDSRKGAYAGDVGKNTWQRDNAIKSDWARFREIPQDFYTRMKQKGATDDELLRAWAIKKGR